MKIPKPLALVAAQTTIELRQIATGALARLSRHLGEEFLPKLASVLAELSQPITLASTTGNLKNVAAYLPLIAEIAANIPVAKHDMILAAGGVTLDVSCCRYYCLCSTVPTALGCSAPIGL